MKLADQIHSMPVWDVHEHHDPEFFFCRKMNLDQLIRNSYLNWIPSRPYPLPAEIQNGIPLSNKEPQEATQSHPNDPGRAFEFLQKILNCNPNHAFVSNWVGGMKALYAIEKPIEEWERSDCEELDNQVRKNYENPEKWVEMVLTRAGIQHVLTDVYRNSVLDVRPALGPLYHSAMRMNAFAMGWNPDSRDHNGVNSWELFSSLGIEVKKFEDFVAGLEQIIGTMKERGQIAIKNALAYDRSLDFGIAKRSEASSVFGKKRPSEEQKKVFSDWVVNYCCELAAEQNIPVQIHVGTGRFRGTEPRNLAALVENHPRTRFLLMHFGFPWSRELLGMAFVYRNIWLDLSWAPLLGPAHFCASLREGIEILPDRNRIMTGGDNWSVEETFGSFLTVKRLLSKTLTTMVDEGEMTESQALKWASGILFENAERFFNEESNATVHATVAPDGVLDMHGFRPEDCSSLVREYLESCRAAGVLEVRLIHGKGKGALKQGVRALLSKLSYVRSFSDAGFFHGSWGATIVKMHPTSE